MSDVEKLITRLKNDNEGIARNIITGSVYKDIENAISTIKELSALYDKAVADVVRLSTQDKWIPIKYRDATDEEEKENGWCYVLECPMPEEDQEILVCYKSGRVDHDICLYDDGWYLDSGYDFCDILAWKPLPEPYKGE